MPAVWRWWLCLAERRQARGSGGEADDAATSGGAAAAAFLQGSMQSLLQAQGFTKVFNVREGMSGGSAGPGWLRRGLPLQ